jgi:hypothetical protein
LVASVAWLLATVVTKRTQRLYGDRKHFSSGRLMSFDSASDLLMRPHAPAVQILRSEPAARSHAAPLKPTRG